MTMPKRYRLIMKTIEAIQVTPESVDRAALWTGGLKVEAYDPADQTQKFVALNIPTLKGVERAEEGDYVVKDPANGGFCVMKRREFEGKYELVN